MGGPKSDPQNGSVHLHILDGCAGGRCCVPAVAVFSGLGKRVV